MSSTKPVRTDFEGERFAFLPALGQVIVFDAARIAFEPSGPRNLAHPVRHNRRKIVQGGAQRLGDQFEKMQVMHGGQHVCAVRALFPPRLDQAACLEALQHRIQQQVLRLAGNAARTEFGEHAEVETGVGKLKSKRALPVDAGAHGVGGLPIAEALEELDDCDQGQSPWGQGRLASVGVERAEILVAVQGAELVAQSHGDGAFGKSGAGDTRSFSGNLADRIRMEAHG